MGEKDYSESGIFPFRLSIAFWLAASLVALIYNFAWPGSFVWDDDTNLLENTLVRGDKEIANPLYPGFIEPYPVYFGSMRLQWKLFGERPSGYLVVNGLLHALNAFLLWVLIKRFGVSVALFSALLFAVHPFAVHSVAWISQHKTVLSTTFYLSSGLFFLRQYQAVGKLSGLGSLFFFILGLLTKPTLILLPVFLLAAEGISRAGNIRSCLIRVSPWFALALFAGLIRIYWLPPPELDETAKRVGEGWLRMAVAGCTLWFSAAKIVFPFDAMMIYPRWDIALWTPWHLLPLLMAIILLFAAWRMRMIFPACWLGLLFFALAMLPVSGLFDNTYFAFAQVANHWMYPGMLGLVPLMAAAIWRFGEWAGKIHFSLRLVIPSIIVLLFVVLAASEAYRFHDALYYYQRGVRENPGNLVARHNLANMLVERGGKDEALPHYLEASRIHPDFWQAHVGAGKIQAEQGKLKEAFDCFRSAYEVFPDNPEINFHIGVLYGQAGMKEEAVNHLGYSLQLNPDDPVAWYNFGVALNASGEKAKSFQAIEHALSLNPDYENARAALAEFHK